MGRSKAKKTRESEAQTNGIPSTVEQGGIFPGEAWLIKQIKEEASKIFDNQMKKYNDETDKTIQNLREEIKAVKKRETEMIEQSNKMKEEIESLKSKLYNHAEKEKTESTKGSSKISNGF